MIPEGPPVAKALSHNEPDGEKRKLGERPGLDTRLVLAVNYADYVSRDPRGRAVPKGNR